MSESARVVLCDIEGGVALLTLNRPKRRNAFTAQMGHELEELLRECDADDSVRAVVVTGAGNHFCAGADLDRGGDTFRTDTRPAAPRPERSERRERLEPWQVRKPIIAAINGSAVGVGLTLPLRYDIRIAARDAKLGFVFVRRGVMPELSSTWILPRLIGVARASELLLSGRIVLGEEAARMGLVNEAVDSDQVVSRAMEIARDIAVHTAPASVALTKRIIWQNLAEPDPAQAARTEARAFAWLGTQADAREGVVAFLEKRPPRWKLAPSSPPDIA